MFRISFLLLFVSFVFATTPFPLKVRGNVLLEKEKSPYLLEDNFVLGAGDTLKVEAGVTVHMGSLAKMLLNGTTEIHGTEEYPVKFIPADSSESWNGVHFISTTSPFSVKHLILEKAFRNTVSNAEGVFENSWFIDNYYGIRITTSPLVILRNCHFERNRFALSAAASTLDTENLSIRKNVFGLYLEGGVEFKGSKEGIAENMEADVREGSVASGNERVPLSVWQRVEAAF